MKRGLLSILASSLIFGYSLTSLAQTEEQLTQSPKSKNLIQRIFSGFAPISYETEAKKARKQHEKNTDEYQEKQERFKGKGVDIDEFMKYLDQTYPESRISNSIVGTHEALKEAGKSVERAANDHLANYGLRLEIKGGKEDEIISFRLVYDF